MVEATDALPAALKGNLQFSSNIVSAGASEHKRTAELTQLLQAEAELPSNYQLQTSCHPIFLISSAIDKCPVPRKENFFFKTW